MAGRQIYDPDGFQNIGQDGGNIGFKFRFKLQYYRGITLSIIRDLKIEVDGEEVPREQIRFTVGGETFTLEEMRTVVDSNYRWEFGDYATVTVLKQGGLLKGRHHIKTVQVVAPSYMPFILEPVCEADFELE